MVERGLPAQGAGGDLAGQRAVALVGQPGADARASACGRSALARRHARQRLVGGYPRRRNHPPLDFVPGATEPAGEELARAHHPPPFRLELENAQDAAVAGDDLEIGRASARDDRARRIRTDGRRQLRSGG